MTRFIHLKPIAPLAAAMLACLSPMAAHAICAGNQETVFACDFGSKQVELCLTVEDQSVTYRFGPSDFPEMELTRDFDEIVMRPWNGVGRAIWDEVSVWNGDVGYALYWHYDKIDYTIGGGLTVYRQEQVLADLACDAPEEGGALFEFETLSFAMEEAGFCRSDTSEPLRQGPCN